MMKKRQRRPRPSTGLSFHPFPAPRIVGPAVGTEIIPRLVPAEEDSVQTQFPRFLAISAPQEPQSYQAGAQRLTDLTSRHFRAHIWISLAKRVAETTKTRALIDDEAVWAHFMQALSDTETGTTETQIDCRSRTLHETRIRTKQSRRKTTHTQTYPAAASFAPTFTLLP